MISYSTYLGGSSSDAGISIAVNGLGSAYVAGLPNSFDFPTTEGAFEPTFAGASDAFVAKLDPTGSSLVYSTYLGGGNVEVVEDLAIDASGNAYLVGGTMSADFPVTAGAFQTTFSNDFDGFVTKLDPTGSDLVYSTYLADANTDFVERIVVNGGGNAYVAGQTYSPNFPTTAGAFQTLFGGGQSDAFAAKLNSAGASLVYSTYLGGSFGAEAANGLAVDAGGHVYVSGFTESLDFPLTADTFQPANAGASDVFVTKLAPTGSTLVYSTYLGGSGADVALRTIIDGEGNAYITGETLSADYPTTSGALQPAFGGGITDVFVTKVDAAGSALDYSTYLGGSGAERGYDLSLDALGRLTVAGGTASDDFPITADALQASFGGASDAFIAKLTATGAAIVFSTYVGVSADDFAFATAVDAAGSTYMTASPGPPISPSRRARCRRRLRESPTRSSRRSSMGHRRHRAWARSPVAARSSSPAATQRSGSSCSGRRPAVRSAATCSSCITTRASGCAL